MDNFYFNMTSEGQKSLETILGLAFGQYRHAVGYAIRPPVTGIRYELPEGMDKRDQYKLGWEKEGKPQRLIFYWIANDRPDFVAFPFKLDAIGAADFAIRWLAELDYGKQPDHDGDNHRGWRAYCEGWGHVDSEYRAFAAIAPAWAMYGK